MNYKLAIIDGFPRIPCAGCHRLMQDFGAGFERCASCTYGASFSESSAGASTALAAHNKRGKLRVLPRPVAQRAARAPGVNAFGEIEIRDARLC